MPSSVPVSFDTGIINPLQNNKMLNPEQESKIDYIIDSFGFAKVAIIMQTLDWRWGPAGSLEVPTISRLKTTARFLLRESVKHGRVASGGIEASYYEPEEEEGEIFELRFVAEQEDSEFWCN